MKIYEVYVFLQSSFKKGYLSHASNSFLTIASCAAASSYRIAGKSMALSLLWRIECFKVLMNAYLACMHYTRALDAWHWWKSFLKIVQTLKVMYFNLGRGRIFVLRNTNKTQWQVICFFRTSCSIEIIHSRGTRFICGKRVMVKIIIVK